MLCSELFSLFLLENKSGLIDFGGYLYLRRYHHRAVSSYLLNFSCKTWNLYRMLECHYIRQLVVIWNFQKRSLRNMEFSSLLQESFTVPQICFVPSTIYLPLLSRAISYLNCLYSMTLNLTKWGCVMSRQKWLFQGRSLFVANQIF